MVREIASTLENAAISCDEKDELKYVVSQAEKCIQTWKAHLLRSINQDQARLDALDMLDANSVLLVLDWAMKFLPRKYRESQANWFGKRGISWHIAVAIRKSPESKTEMLTFVHIFQSCSQDSHTVLAIIDDVLGQLKTIMPKLNRVFLRQDNAGCYHSAPTLLPIHEVAKKHNLAIRVDFSDPQGGKGSCDRKAANLKNHMKIYLNAGHDIESAQQMRDALASSGGIPGVRVRLCSTPDSSKSSKSVKWDGVSSINNIEYTKTGMKVWKAYKVGPGKLVPWSNFSMTPAALETLNHEETTGNADVTFTAITVRKLPKTDQSDVQQQVESPDPLTASLAPESIGNEKEQKLFHCPEEGCVKSFQRHSFLQSHLDIGRHKFALEHETLLDKAMVTYATKLEQGASAVECSLEHAATSTEAADADNAVLPMGWALKSGSGRKRVSEHQKRYLTEIFQAGEVTGHKADPAHVSTSMRKARNAEGSSMMFHASEYLTSRQISSFFSRLASKKVLETHDHEEEDSEDETNEVQERAVGEICSEAMEKVAVQHPIMYNMHNICDIVTSSRLSKFSVQMLQDICKYFELDISTIKVKRKKPYVDLVTQLVKTCGCS